MQIILNGIEHLQETLAGATKVFVVSDSSFPFLNIKDDIEKMGVPHVMFSDFTPNPLYEQVCKGIDLFQVTQCDCILAVGGGSAIDVAKCIKLAVLAEEGNAAIIPPLVSQQLPIDGTQIPFIAIPTTAGTGSESTHNAVMYYDGAKQTVTNDGVLPDYAILEPSVLKTLPLYQKKCTMMDALCQGIESWWSVNSTEESYEYSRKTIELIMVNWRKYIFDNDDEAAANIMLAANYGGRAINITATTAAHAMSYKITSLYRLPHGHAVAVCLPEIWEYMLGHMDKCLDCRGQEYLANIFLDISKAMGCLSPKQAIAIFRQMLSDMEINNPVATNKVEDLDILSHSVNPVRMKNNPVKLDTETIYKLYKTILNSSVSLTIKSTRSVMKEYDYLIVGSGLFGATFAYRARQLGKKCLVIDKRSHLGGNVYCENIEGINVHKYGAHIFHTSNKDVWNFVNSIVPFNRYTNSPVANYKGKLYNLPFNMNTFYQMWGVTTPEEAQAKIDEQKAEAVATLKGREPQNLEEQALTLVGRDIFEKLIKEYTEKQWGRKCTELPAFIIKRLPVRLVFDNNYFNDKYQGIPIGGYNMLINGLLEGIECKTDTDFFNSEFKNWQNYADRLVYTGPLDEFYDYRFGKLDWRTVSFKTYIKDSPNYQGNAVVNYTSHEFSFTRIIEHKHFEMFGQTVYECPKTVISEEYSTEYKDGMEPYYPVNDDRNNHLAEQYRNLAEQEKNIIFGGRLAEYKYYDMAPIIEKVLGMRL